MFASGHGPHDQAPAMIIFGVHLCTKVPRSGNDQFPSWERCAGERARSSVNCAGTRLEFREGRMGKALRRLLFAFLLPLACVVAGVASGVRPVHAEDPEMVARRERCATRLSITLLGKAPSATLLAAANPQGEVDALVETDDFAERFARFTNAAMNDAPGATPAQDAVYYLAKYIFQNGKPWKDLFLGPYGLDTSTSTVTVTADPNGLGYFRFDGWLRRYAGNEAAGYKIVTANRILKNLVDLQLTAVTTSPETDVSANGRQAAECAGCHFNGWFALDKIARVLTRRVGTGSAMTFAPPIDGPQEVLDGVTVANDKELVTALVDSEAFRFRTCRLAFRFATGRNESECEGTTFDACMREFSAKGTMEAAVAAIVKAPTFCDGEGR
jgi:hypothetical protein